MSHTSHTLERNRGRAPLPRFRNDVRLVIELSAASPEEADARLLAIMDFIEARTHKSTFARLPGKPEVLMVDTISDSTLV